MKLIKSIWILFVSVLLAYVFYSAVNYFGEDSIIRHKEENYSSGITLEQIQEIAELATVEYLVEARMIIDKPKVRVWIFDIPQTEKYYIAMAQGKVKAGIDLEKIIVLRADKDEVVLRLPEARILDKYIDPTTKWEKEIERLFSEINSDEITEAQIKAEEDMVNRAISNGILEKAYENAKRMIESFIKLSGVKSVIFE
ncbi:MAG: DUF4230 domain-containing protein [Bacillota bacterium]